MKSLYSTRPRNEAYDINIINMFLFITFYYTPLYHQYIDITNILTWPI